MSRASGALLALLVAWASPDLARAHGGAHGEMQGGAHGEEAPTPLTESAGFDPPAPGSYELPPIQRVASHQLLDATGAPAPLPGVAPGQVGFVAFIYLSCPAACPRTLGVLQRLDRELAADPALRARVAISAVSFDPERDGTEALAALRANLAPRGPWRFLTARDAAALSPVLADYGQDVVPLIDETGHPTGLLRHVLKVFLLDDRQRVRNVYSSEFLDWRLLRNDVLTLLAEGA